MQIREDSLGGGAAILRSEDGTSHDDGSCTGGSGLGGGHHAGLVVGSARLETDSRDHRIEGGRHFTNGGQFVRGADDAVEEPPERSGFRQGQTEVMDAAGQLGIVARRRLAHPGGRIRAEGVESKVEQQREIASAAAAGVEHATAAWERGEKA